MTTITYQCSICSRTIDILEKPRNINVFSKCIITNGCRGKLNKLSRNIDNIRETFPAPVANLKDYIQRKIFFKFNQLNQNSEWLINHDLGAVPAVDVFVQEDVDKNNLTKLTNDHYKIEIVDKNIIKVKLNVAYAGVAHLVARTSIESIDLEEKKLTDAIISTRHGVFAFAIPKFLTRLEIPHIGYPTAADLPLDLKDKEIRLMISLTEPNKEEVICFEPVNLTPNSASPWVGWHELLIRKRKNYYTRFNSIFNFNQLFEQDKLTISSIPEGTQIRFLEIDLGTGFFQPIEQGDLILLLADAPYQPVDKIRNKIIDVGAMINNDFDYFYYSNGELYTSTQNVQNVYPMIEKVN